MNLYVFTNINYIPCSVVTDTGIIAANSPEHAKELLVPRIPYDYILIASDTMLPAGVVVNHIPITSQPAVGYKEIETTLNYCVGRLSPGADYDSAVYDITKALATKMNAAMLMTTKQSLTGISVGVPDDLEQPDAVVDGKVNCLLIPWFNNKPRMIWIKLDMDRYTRYSRIISDVMMIEKKFKRIDVDTTDAVITLLSKRCHNPDLFGDLIGNALDGFVLHCTTNGLDTGFELRYLSPEIKSVQYLHKRSPAFNEYFCNYLKGYLSMPNNDIEDAEVLLTELDDVTGALERMNA